eukprot:74627-Chlamydomonas_euryale.AAC.16
MSAFMTQLPPDLQAEEERRSESEHEAMQQRNQARLAKAQAEQMSIWRSRMRWIPSMGHNCVSMHALRAGQMR